MADWGSSAKDRDRDAAIKVVEAAAARGQIVEADKDYRIAQIKSASTMGEIDMITRGLAAAPPATDSAPWAEPAWSDQAWAPSADAPPPTSPSARAPTDTPPWATPDGAGAGGASMGGSPYASAPQVEYGGPLGVSSGGGTSTAVVTGNAGKARGCMIAFLLILAIGIAGFVYAVSEFVGDGIDTIDEFTEGVTEGTVEEQRTVDPFSAAGLKELADDLEAERGSTRVFQAVLLEDHASLDVPAEAKGDRSITYWWRGELQEINRGSAPFDDRVDLREVRAGVASRLLAKAAKLVEDPTSTYLVVRAPLDFDKGATLFAYATNDFNESAYLGARWDGKVVRKVLP